MIAQIALFTAFAIVVLLAATAIKHIPEGHAYSLQRFGKPSRMLLPGTHMILPLVDRVVHKINLGGRALQVNATFSGKNNGSCNVDGLVYWQVLEPERADAFIDRAEELIRRGAMDALGVSEDPVGEAVPARNARLKQALNQSLRSRGVLVTRVDLNLAA